MTYQCLFYCLKTFYNKLWLCFRWIFSIRNNNTRLIIEPNLEPRSPTARWKGDLTFQPQTEWDLGSRLSLNPITEMPTSRDLKSGDFCHTDNVPPPPCIVNYIPPAVSPLNPSSPPKTHPLSFYLCFLRNPRCINALRNGQTSLKNWNCFSLDRRAYAVEQGLFLPGDLVTPAGDREIRSSCGRLPDNPEERAWSKRCSLRWKEIHPV